MVKIDFKKELKLLYNVSAKEVVIVNVPRMNFLMIEGSGDPNTAQEYKDAVEELFAVSFRIKFMIKKGEVVDYVVLPLEGLWWIEETLHFSVENKEKWKWAAIIMQPKYVTKDLVDVALKEVEEKKNPPALSKIRFESFHEGLSAQILHVGPYSAEGQTIQKLHHFIKENGYELRGRHHEIYLSDPRRSKPEKMKTILRQPIR